MYNELYAAWQLEIERSELGCLTPNFYTRLVAYLQQLDEASKSHSEKSLKASLLYREISNAKYMAAELVSTRYRKIIQLLMSMQEVPTDVLTSEEVCLCNNLSPFTKAYSQFTASILDGQAAAIPAVFSVQVKISYPTKENETTAAPTATISAPVIPSPSAATHKRVTVRFLKMVPAIVGSDMKTYGPFVAEDVASVPESNAKILIRRGLAKMVELP